MVLSRLLGPQECQICQQAHFLTWRSMSLMLQEAIQPTAHLQLSCPRPLISLYVSIWASPLDLWYPRPRFRAWTGRSREAGSWTTDQMRAITGVGAEGLTDAAAHITGAFFSSYAVKVGGFVGATETSAVYACANAFDSSRVVPTGPVTVPPHVWQPIILYLGLPA